jgi:hypothetical protein
MGLFLSETFSSQGCDLEAEDSRKCSRSCTQSENSPALRLRIVIAVSMGGIIALATTRGKTWTNSLSTRQGRWVSVICPK